MCVCACATLNRKATHFSISILPLSVSEEDGERVGREARGREGERELLTFDYIIHVAHHQLAFIIKLSCVAVFFWLVSKGIAKMHNIHGT